MQITINGKSPDIAENAYIAPTAVVVGDVTIGEKSGVWFNAVVRGDMSPITIGESSNIQDNCTLHTDPGCPLTIGDNVTIGHNAVVHGCTIEDHVLIGMNAVVLNNAVIRSGSIVAAGAVVREGQEVGPCQLVAGMPARVKREVDEQTIALIDLAADHYVELALAYAQGTPDS